MNNNDPDLVMADFRSYVDAWEKLDVYKRQRLRPVPRGGLQAPPERLLRGPRRAAVRGLGARLVQARDRRRRARRDVYKRQG